jgi:hypothetical protein
VAASEEGAEPQVHRSLGSQFAEDADVGAAAAAAAGDDRPVADGPSGRGRRHADAHAHGGGRAAPRAPPRRAMQKRQRPLCRRTPQVDSLGRSE